jgi:hypothetical protein
MGIGWYNEETEAPTSRGWRFFFDLGGWHPLGAYYLKVVARRWQGILLKAIY